MPPSVSNVGRDGEQIAADFLKKLGYKILCRNWKTPRWGEIDIVALDGKDLVFAEVKTRTTLYGGEPLEAVNYYKLRTLKRAALYFKEANPNTPNSLRIDVLSIILFNPPVIEHLKNVYEDTLT